MSRNKRKSFSQSIFDKNSILLLKKDAKLKNDGTEIYFVVDTFDIIDFCFPFFRSNDKKDPSLNNRHIAYKYLFFTYENKAIIPDEYLKELCSFKYRLGTAIKDGKSAIQNIQEFMINNNFDELTDVTDMFLKNINTILALALDLLNPDSIKRFNEIINNRLDISEVNIKEVNDKEVVNEIFETSKQSDITNKIFNEFYEEIKYFLLGSNSSAQEKYNYLNNSYKDIIVIDRCIQVNKKINKAYEDKKIKNKYLFLYVSSTPNKSEKLFSLKTVKKSFPNISNSKYNILRNSPQLYLQSILKDKDFDNGIKFLDLLYDYSDKTQELSNQGSDFESLRKKINDQLKITNEEVERDTQLQNFFLLKEQVTKAIEESSINNDIHQFRELIQTVFKSKKLIKKFNSCEEIIRLNTRNHRAELTLLKLIKSIESSDHEIKVNTGKDIVRSNYQSFPILLFYNTEDDMFSIHWSKFIKLISNHLSHPSKNNLEIKNDFIKAFSSALKALKPKFNHPQSPFIVSIIFNYLSLIVPGSFKEDANNNIDYLEKEEAIINELLNIKLLFNSSFIKGYFNNQNNQLEIRKEGHRYEGEINYILVWLYRRQAKYDMAIKLANESLKRYPNDPRLIQGKALAMLSKVYEQDNNNILAYEQIIKLISHAINIFKKEEHIELVQKTIIALKNTLCYIHTRLYILSKDVKQIERAEKYLNEIEIYLDSTDFNLKLFPAFCDTATNFYINKCEISIKDNNNQAIKDYQCAKDYFKHCENSWLYVGIENEVAKINLLLDNLKSKINFTNKH